MKTIYIILSLFLVVLSSNAQEKYLTKQGQVSFFSSTPVEDIKADNNQVLSILDSKDGKVAISILMKSFMFDKQLMQEHFNENYVESDKFPKALFKGDIKDFNNISEGANDITIAGNITIHGVTKPIEILTKLVKEGETISLKGTFLVLISDFDIEIPSAVTKNIANSIEVNFALNHKLYKK